MRNICISVFLLLACLIMLSSMTSSYFSTQSDLNDIFNTAGVLEIELDASCDSGWDDWKPNEAKQVTWSIRNIGNKKAYLRVEITGQWESEGTQPNNNIEEPISEMSSMYITVSGEVYGEPRRTSDNEKYNIDAAHTQEPNVNWDYTGSKWRKGDDGCWYYPEVLGPGEQVELCFNLSLDTINGYWGREYKIDFTAEAVQASNSASDSIPGWNIP